ncbi:MAG: hypothetical protein QOC96_1717 [Acidobacteriota bacterium]|jgi:hypothetical protein|nr:hypothetical protein [Acidobacteriota bacterium]
MNQAINLGSVDGLSKGVSISATGHQVLSFFVMTRERVTSILTSVRSRAARDVITEVYDVGAVENLSILFVQLPAASYLQPESVHFRDSQGANNLYLSFLFV